MTEQSTIHYERTSPLVAKITFANLIVGETVLHLTEIVDEFATNPDIQVVVFDSSVPDFFYNHFDLAASADFPAPEGEGAVPVWTELVLKVSKAPIHHDRNHPRPHPWWRQRTRTRVRSALRQPREGDLRTA